MSLALSTSEPVGCMLASFMPKGGEPRSTAMSILPRFLISSSVSARAGRAKLPAAAKAGGPGEKGATADVQALHGSIPSSVLGVSLRVASAFWVYCRRGAVRSQPAADEGFQFFGLRFSSMAPGPVSQTLPLCM